MAKARSPNYPNYDLASALVLARKLYEKDNRNKLSAATISSHLGHESVSGPALGKIGALRAYGLLEGSGDDNRISEDAVTALMAPDGSPDKTEVLTRLASKPSLFAEISKSFPTPPSDENLRYWPVKRGFLPEGAAKAAKTYLATMALATTNGSGHPVSVSEATDEPAENDTSSHVSLRRRAFPDVSNEPPPAAGTRREVITLDEGDVIIIFPDNLSADSFADLKEHLELFVKKMTRRALRAAQESELRGPNVFE